MLTARNELTSALDAGRRAGLATLRAVRLAHAARPAGASGRRRPAPGRCAAQGLLKGEAEQRPPLSPEEARAARERADRARARPAAGGAAARRWSAAAAAAEPVRAAGAAAPRAAASRPSVTRTTRSRERIWLGYHDRLHAADVRRALRMQWYPPESAVPARAAAPPSTRSRPDETLYVIYSVDPVFWERPSPVPGWTTASCSRTSRPATGCCRGTCATSSSTASVAPWPDVDAGNARARRGARAFDAPSA